jgi:hypothetical protein
VRPQSRTAAAALAVIALLLGAGACTDSEQPAAAPSPSPSPTASEPPAPRSAPFTVAVTRVLGTLPAKDRPALEANIRRTLSTYVDAAFLAGEYPRSDFSASFAPFTSGAARDARRDQALLTNLPLGPTTESVRATRRAAYLSVLAPYKVAAGVTARVDLAFLVDRADQPPERVSLKGRFLLTRDEKDGWSIFGYDVHRSDTPAPAGSGS